MKGKVFVIGRWEKENIKNYLMFLLPNVQAVHPIC